MSNRGAGPAPGRNLLARPNQIQGPVYRGEDPPRPEPLPELKKKEESPPPPGFVFAKCCKLPDRQIDYPNGHGPLPIDTAKDYGSLVLLGGREPDEQGWLPLKRISGSVPAGLGSLALLGLSTSGAGELCGGSCEVLSTGGAVARGAQVIAGGGEAIGGGLLTGGVVAGTLLGLVALLWPSSLEDGALYTEDQLRSMSKARTRVRIRVEEQPDGTLKGYGYNTQLRSDWEMIPVVQFNQQGDLMVADLGDGIGLIWTPAADPMPGIPALEAAPQAPHIWVFPPTEQADNIIVSPIYPPDYRDCILVFPAGSGIAPLYIVLNARHDPGVVTGAGEDVFGTWLAGAGEGLGAPIPTRIADRLRGRSFGSFDSFRKALWLEVSKDSELMAQLSQRNQKLVRNGKAPYAPATEHNGENRRYEIHHIENIQHGGAVYDIDNLSVATPKRHVEIHREDRL